MKQKTIPQNADDMERMIYNELCDVLDAPELYDDCVMAVNRKDRTVSIGSPMSFNREFETFLLTDMFRIEEESQDYEVDPDAVGEVVGRYF